MTHTLRSAAYESEGRCLDLIRVRAARFHASGTGMDRSRLWSDMGGGSHRSRTASAPTLCKRRRDMPCGEAPLRYMVYAATYGINTAQALSMYNNTRAREYSPESWRPFWSQTCYRYVSARCMSSWDISVTKG